MISGGLNLVVVYRTPQRAADGTASFLFTAGPGQVYPILVDNSRDSKGLCARYAEWGTAGPFDATVFVHDDVQARQPQWVEAVQKGLENFDIVGVAGNRRYSLSYAGWWNDFRNPQDLVGAVIHAAEGKEWVSRYGYAPTSGAPAVIADGLFLAARTAALKEGLWEAAATVAPGFHFYDVAFCLEAWRRRLRVGVIPLALQHASIGEMPPAWYWVRERVRAHYKAEMGDRLLEPHRPLAVTLPEEEA